jgi:hypothetical protein
MIGDGNIIDPSQLNNSKLDVTHAIVRIGDHSTVGEDRSQILTDPLVARCAASPNRKIDKQ